VISTKTGMCHHTLVNSSIPNFMKLPSEVVTAADDHEERGSSAY
jgi:hypothetical protein